MGPESEAFEVLLALEKAARAPDFHLLDLSEVFNTNKWSAIRNIENDVDPFSDDLEHEIMGADLTSRFMASAHQIDAIVSMSSVLSKFANELQMRFKRARESISAKLSDGSDGLPIEIVTKIFQFAVWAEGRNGGNQAIRLSQVSRRFRNVALASRSLWATLCSYDSPSQLETFISRAGPHEEYHAFARYDSHIHSSGIDWFVNSCQSIVPHWRTMTLTQDEKVRVSDPPVIGGVSVLLGVLSSSFNERGLHLPMLEKLDVRGHSKDLYVTVERDSYEWAPNLRSLRCWFTLLSPTAALTSVTTFDFTQIITDRFNAPILPLILLLKFLGFLPNLTTFSLTLHGANEFVCDLALRATECPSIVTFRLQLRGLEAKIDHQPQRSCLASFMNALRMPSLENINFSLGFVDTGVEMEDEAWSRVVGDLSIALMPKHLSELSQPTSLYYFLWLDRGNSLVTEMQEVPRDNRAFYIPLDRIFSIRNLIISSWVRVQFIKEASNLRKADFSERCRLRELKFVGCENMTGADLSSIVSSLVREFDVWKNIERVAVEYCTNVADEDLMRIIGEEKLHHPARGIEKSIQVMSGVSKAL
ncbi:hypothetical protein SCHPADRAFT_944580 [Schizopora paradoxa]|uniref:Uncharacterized protein n=1 Tax=Schizopora paradoxa TaxID=27342 RepID=A0A0H2RA89_9AGAM|nr:hypothetical protein SCHPADRAFT_944580 [Schizopora paradoxa]